MNKPQQIKLELLYRKHVNALKCQGKAESTIDVYARAVRRVASIGIAARYSPWQRLASAIARTLTPYTARRVLDALSKKGKLPDLYLGNFRWSLSEQVVRTAILWL